MLDHNLLGTSTVAPEAGPGRELWRSGEGDPLVQFYFILFYFFEQCGGGKCPLGKNAHHFFGEIQTNLMKMSDLNHVTIFFF